MIADLTPEQTSRVVHLFRKAALLQAQKWDVENEIENIVGFDISVGSDWAVTLPYADCLTPDTVPISDTEILECLQEQGDAQCL
jgi:hypothetical protein